MSAPRHVYRRRDAQAVYALHYGPNMTPMVDVVMVILIFFMASAVVLGPEWFVRTNLPRADTASTPTPGSEPLRLTVRMTRADGATSVQFNTDAPLALDQGVAGVQAIAQRRAPEDIIMLFEPAGDVPYEDVVLMHAACREAGIARVGLVGK